MPRKKRSDNSSKNLIEMEASAVSSQSGNYKSKQLNSRRKSKITSAKEFEPGLYVVATPIGNARDITLRALDLLACADVIACEDRRVTQKLLNIHNISTPTMTYHDHNAFKIRPKLLKRLNKNEIVALVSDAGTPLISDPGYRLVKDTRDAGLKVTALPGASAALAALASAGLPTDCFIFLGFLPIKSTGRRKALAAVSETSATLVIYETAARLTASLADMAIVLGDRQAAVMRELTKKFEEVRRGDLDNLVTHYENAGPPKGEIVVLIAPGKSVSKDISQDSIDTQLRSELAVLHVKDAASVVAERTGLTRRSLYNRAVKLLKEK